MSLPPLSSNSQPPMSSPYAPLNVGTASMPLTTLSPQISADDAAIRALIMAEARSGATQSRSAAPTLFNDNLLRQAVTESQHYHMAHSRELLHHDIEFRRSIELASAQSAAQSNTVRGEMLETERKNLELAQELSLKSEQEYRRMLSEFDHLMEHAIQQSKADNAQEIDEENLVQMISQQSILDAKYQQTQSEKKYVLELELALKESERFEMLKREEEELTRRSEEELVRHIMSKSQTQAKQPSVSTGDEEDVFNKILEQSRAEEDDKARSAAEEERIELEKALQISLQEGQKSDEEEQEQMNMALEWSLHDGEYYDEFENKQNELEEERVNEDDPVVDE